MAHKALLFAYGTLMPGHSPPRSMSAHWPDRIKGRLYDLGEYPGVTDVGQADALVEGFTVEFDADELDALDAYEDVESGEFTRRVVVTEAGHTAWVYELTRKPPPGAVARTRWKVGP